MRRNVYVSTASSVAEICRRPAVITTSPNPSQELSTMFLGTVERCHIQDGYVVKDSFPVRTRF